MSERDRLLREIALREELLGLYALLRQADGTPPTPWPGASPNKASPQEVRGIASPPEGVEVAMVTGPNGAVEPDMTNVERVVRQAFRARNGRDPSEGEVVGMLMPLRDQARERLKDAPPGARMAFQITPG